MTEKAKSRRDAFTFSLGGMRTISSYTAAQAIAHDALNKALDEKLRLSQADQPDTAREMTSFWGRFWLRALRRAA